MADIDAWETSTGYEAAIAVVALMFALAGIALGAGIGFRIRWLQDWGRDELMQTAINAAMVGGLLVFFGSTGAITLLMNEFVVPNDFVMTFAGQVDITAYGTPDLLHPLAGVCGEVAPAGGMTPSCYAQVYLTFLAKSLTDSIIILSKLILVVAFLATLGINLVIVTITPFAGLEAYVGIFSSLLQFLVVLLTMSTVQQLFLKFIDSVAIPVLLPVGLILRSFFVTRRLGGALMAIAIGLAVVFPLTFVLDGKMLTEDFNAKSPTSGQDGSINSTYAKVIEDVKVVMNFENLFIGPPNLMIPNIPEIIKKVAALADLYDTFGLNFEALTQVVWAYVATMIVMIVILPFFNVMVTLVSIRELASLLGSEFGGGSFSSI